MSQSAIVTITGYVATEPKLVLTKHKQTPVVNLRIGSTYRRLDTLTGEWRELGTSFFTVNCWNRLAFGAAASLRKGEPIIVRGRLKTRAWTDNGTTRTVHEIEADAIGHNMAYGWSHFMKGVHPKLEGMLAALGGRDSSAEGADSPVAEGGPYPNDRDAADDRSFPDDRDFADEDGPGGGLPGEEGPAATPGMTDLELPEPPDGLTPPAGDGAAEPGAPQASDLAAEAVPL